MSDRTEIDRPTPSPDERVRRHVVPLPLSDNYDKDAFLSGKGDAPGIAQIWGHCAAFCVSSDSTRTDGLTIGEHGLYCRSSNIAAGSGMDVIGAPVSAYASVVKPYNHGTYRREDVWGIGDRAPGVQLKVVGTGLENPEAFDDELPLNDEPFAKALNLTIGEARRLAAGLVRAADVADQLDLDFNGAKARRAADA